ncbi:MAG: HAD family phosphatase [Muribaculaceae bacterium]|nr:HAD family phosphatase [Muribaculaceae bacterium]
MKNIGVLFDLDGVLIDSETEYTRIWGEVHRRYPTGVEDLPHKIKGMTLDNIIATYFNDREDKQQLRDTLHELENQMTYEWLPGAKEFIEWLISENIPRALVTSSDNEKMAHLREQLPELESMMTTIVTADKISKSKPDPEGYLLAAKLIGIPPQHCAVVEDSLQGVKAGRASGAFVIGMEGTLPAETIAPYSDIVINNFKELDKNIILNLDKRNA